MPVPFLDLPALHRPVGSRLRELFDEVVTSGAFVGGPYVEQFEHDWAAYCGRVHAVGVGNGTDALELAIRGLGIGAGDEVLVPANTFVATAEAVVAAGATVRFVDVDPGTLLVSADAIARAIGPRTAAAIVVHLYGQLADMDAIAAVVRRHGLALIEDAAQAHGARWRDGLAGSFGDVACFSFYPGKNLGALGDAGAVVTDDPRIAERVRSIGDHGRDETYRHRHARLGRNSRLDGLQAAVLSTKLPLLDGWNAGRRRAASTYRELLAELPVRPIVEHPDATSVHHLFVVRVADRGRVRDDLAGVGIGTGIHYPEPCHHQAAFRDRAQEPLPVVEEAASEILSLPMSPTLTGKQVATVAGALAAATAPSSRRAGTTRADR